MIGNPETNQMIAATPVAQGSTESTGLDSEDSLIRWFEEHARRLSTGYYTIGRLRPSSRAPSILQYPSTMDTFRCIPRCSRTVTRGIEIMASSVFHPFSNITERGWGLHLYSIRVRILTPQDQEYLTPEQRGFTTCQLHSRHWFVQNQCPSLREGATTMDEIRGEGVVGNYPLLVEGGFQDYYSEYGVNGIFETTRSRRGSFAYQSWRHELSQSFEGYLLFIPGSLYNPERGGEPFYVRVAPFHLCRDPGYYY